MRKWRLIAFGVSLLFIMGKLHLLGLRQPESVPGVVIVVGLAIILCICDAADAIRADERR